VHTLHKPVNVGVAVVAVRCGAGQPYRLNYEREITSALYKLVVYFTSLNTTYICASIPESIVSHQTLLLGMKPLFIKFLSWAAANPWQLLTEYPPSFYLIHVTASTGNNLVPHVVEQSWRSDLGASARYWAVGVLRGPGFIIIG
jgi:hypothetical protein